MWNKDGILIFGQNSKVENIAFLKGQKKKKKEMEINKPDLQEKEEIGGEMKK